MVWAAVPETTVNEYGDARWSKHNVWSYPAVGDAEALVLAETQTTSV